MLSAGFVSLLALPLLARAQTYSATYLPSNVPPQTEQGQSGTNQCGTGSNQTSNCQNVYVNAVDDFCIFAPPEPGPNSVIGNTERIEVSWCIKPGYGTRVIPDGTFSGAHFVQTPDYVQVTGVGDLTKINIPSGDTGGELDPHGADGNGNPIGGLVFSSAFGQLQQIHEWTNFVSDTEFCIRACKDGPGAPTLCQHIYDVLGCMWNMPADYDAGVFENCKGDSALPMGVYGSSTFHQGDPSTPSAHPIPPSSLCTPLSTIGNLAASSSASPSSSASGSSTTVSSSTASSSGAASASGSASGSGSGSASGSSSAGSSPHPSAPASVSSSRNTSSSGAPSPSSPSANVNNTTPSSGASQSGSSGASSGASHTGSSSGSPSPTGAASNNGAFPATHFGWEKMLVALGLVAAGLALA